jgi:DNA primase
MQASVEHESHGINAPMTRTEHVLMALGLKISNAQRSRAWLLCPFHQNADDPIAWGTTFFIRMTGDRAGAYHCFSCKAKGSLASLVMHVRACDFKKAKAFIEDAVKNFRRPRAHARVVRQRAVLTRPTFELPGGIIFKPLDQWDSTPREYAVDDRGLTAEDVERFEIGYAVDGYLGCRLVFVGRNARGRVVNYSARTFVDEEPRYLFPSAKDHADLDALFGENLWPPLGERDAVIVTEGVINHVAAARVSGLPTGAFGSTDVRPGHIVTLATWKRVLILTDPDGPGDKAARVLRIGLGRHVLAERVKLPAKSDAATLAMKDPDLLRAEITNALERTKEG